MNAVHLTPRFVETIPEGLDAGVLYVSMNYATAIHLCACGCGKEVVTPFSPTDWKLYFDGENVTLHPSIGNWSFPCRSHYWIRGGKIQCAGTMLVKDIDNGRAYDRKRKAAYYDMHETPDEHPPEVVLRPAKNKDSRKRRSRLAKLWNSLKGRAD
jgi:hypothetical protein